MPVHRDLMVCNSSPANGSELRNVARSIMAFTVVFIERSSFPWSGSPQIDMANSIITVLPDPLSPYRWNTNGFSWTSPMSGEAKDAAIINRTSKLTRNGSNRFTHSSRVPLLRIALYSALYSSPPSN